MSTTYSATSKRYEQMIYNRTGRSGLKLPALSLGLWHNFGGTSTFENMRSMIRTAFDLGITHFDLANNYGPPPGSAEENFGRLLATDLKPYRDELIISTKAGYHMYPGPYGEWGSRKYLLASLDASLKRMGLDYVDIFYSHRFDPETPLEETMGALASAVQQGKALYVGISSYSAAKTREAAALLEQMGVKCLIHQPSYSMLNRWIEAELLDALEQLGIGCIAFSPLAQGMLTPKYLKGIPEDARANKAGSFRKDQFLTEENLANIRALNDVAQRRGQSLTQMALAWCLRDPRITSVLIGASRPEQIRENVDALQNLTFADEELREIDRYAQEGGINIWAQSSEAG
jgi:L-glyceraldehyde 3-phosphate reductase